MFVKKLLAFICTGMCGSWCVVWTGYDLNQLSKSDLDYFVSFYGRDNLRFISEYAYDSDDLDDFNDWFED